MSPFLVLLPLLAPLFTAAACLLLWNHIRWQRIVSLIGGVVLLASSIALMTTVQREGIQIAQLGNWPAPFGITLIADLFSSVMTLVSAIVGLLVLIYSFSDIDTRRQNFGYHPLLHILLLGVSGAFLTGDIFNMYVWFEVMLIASFVLVALGGERAQLEGAVKYVTLNLISSTLFLSACGVLYGTTGTLNMADLSEQIAASEQSAVTGIAGGILVIAFGLKAAVFPLFFWLPASYHTPPAAISAVMAGLLTKVGVYALIRTFSLLFVQDFSYAQPLLLIVAGATMITGVLGAAAQGEFRRILSFHIISQIGYMIMGLAIYTPLALAGAVFYLVHHIIVKTNLFLIAGIVERIQGTGSLSKLGGLYRDRLWLAMLTFVPAMSLAGIPPLSGFWAKLAVLRASVESEHYVLLGVALLVSLLTLFSMTKVWNEVFWKARKPMPDGSPAPEPGVTPAGMAAPCIALASLTLVIGLAAEPLFALAQSTANQLLDPSIYVDAVQAATKGA